MDASVLINMLHIGRVLLLSQVGALQPLVPDEVLAEILLPTQREALLAAIDDGHLTRVSIDDPAVLETFADLRDYLGKGEAACLAIAQHGAGIAIASDEKGAFLRMATERLGPGRVLSTADILFMGIRAGLISVAEADAAKELLAAHRFRMPFASFRELVNVEPPRGPDDGR